jgi:hypothetical protein
MFCSTDEKVVIKLYWPCETVSLKKAVPNSILSCPEFGAEIVAKQFSVYRLLLCATYFSEKKISFI